MSAEQYPWTGIRCWTYEASIHCNRHAIERFGEPALFDLATADREGNPIHPVFSWECDGFTLDDCDECQAEAIATRSPIVPPILPEY
jgi:hypothetical protein